jgi:hypothetical protein
VRETERKYGAPMAVAPSYVYAPKHGLSQPDGDERWKPAGNGAAGGTASSGGSAGGAAGSGGGWGGVGGARGGICEAVGASGRGGTGGAGWYGGGMLGDGGGASSVMVTTYENFG